MSRWIVAAGVGVLLVAAAVVSRTAPCHGLDRLGPGKPQATWTVDGRLLLLAGLADDPASGLVAAWRPGQPRIAVRRVPLPEPGPPSGFRFVIW